MVLDAQYQDFRSNKRNKKSNKNKIVKEEKEIVLEINMEEKKFRIRHKTHHPVLDKDLLPL